ncbi:hypothetical protein G6F24_016185 [Rhizopus arrhizus]|nr:hypothetical protein G6F24_016185 [Rhizopus arrhizus]
MPECEQRRSLADFDDRQALAGKAIGLCLRPHRPQGGAQALAAGGAQGAAADRGWRAGTRADGGQRGFAAQQSGQVQADAALAKVSAERWQGMLGSHSVSRQEADEKQANAVAAQASVEAAQADYARLQELGRYRTLRAP